MRYLAYTSKLYAIAFLTMLLLFSGCISLFWNKLPLFAQIVAGVLFALGLLSCVISLAHTGPVLVADEEGLYARNLGMKKIPWAYLAAAERLPRVYKDPGDPRSTHFFFTEGWRAIVLSVREEEKFLIGLAKAARGLRLAAREDKKHPGCTLWALDVSGTTADSGALLECIQHYLDQQKPAGGG